MPDKYTKQILVRNDSVVMVGGTRAYYSPDNDEIRLLKGDLTEKDFGMQGNGVQDEDILLVHEAQHQINARKGCGHTPMSLAERYQEAMHDEIVASIAEKLEIRRRYQQLKSDGEKNAFFKKFAGDRKNAAYLKLLQSGKINPNSKSSEDFAEEMAFIKNSSTDWWVKHDALEYQKNQNGQIMDFLREYGENAVSNPQGLADNLKKMYHIGGIDFTRYGQDNSRLPVENQTLAALETMRAEGADAQKLQAFNNMGEGPYKLAESLDVSGLSYDQAAQVIQTAIINEHLAAEIAGSMALGEKPSFDFRYVASSLRNQTAVYLDMKADVWEKNGILNEQGDEEKFARLMQQAKTVKLDPDKWLEEVRDILTIAKDPNRADEFAALKQRMAGLRGKSVSLDEAVVNMDKFRLPLDGSSKEEVLEEMRQKAEEDARWAEEYNKKHPQKERISEAYHKSITDMESNLLKDELEARREAEREVKPLTTKPPTLSYKLMDGVKYYFNRPQQYQNIELKSYVNERGEKIEMTLVDGKKHGAAVLRDENDNIKEVKAYDNGQEIDLSKHKFGIDEQERTINGKPARATTFMLDGKPFGAVVVETADGTKADFYDSRGVRMEGAAGAKIRRTEERVESARDSVRQTMPSAEAEHSEEAVPAAKENVPAETADTLQVKKTPLAEDEQVQPADSVQKVVQEMRRGHDRIAAMRAKVAAGHEADRAAVYREVFGGNDNIEAIRRLRSSKTISSGVVRPTAIRADLLEGKLREFQAQP